MCIQWISKDLKTDFAQELNKTWSLLILVVVAVRNVHNTTGFISSNWGK